jgi:hypothetical protein
MQTSGLRHSKHFEMCADGNIAKSRSNRRFIWVFTMGLPTMYICSSDGKNDLLVCSNNVMGLGDSKGVDLKAAGRFAAPAKVNPKKRRIRVVCTCADCGVGWELPKMSE